MGNLLDLQFRENDPQDTHFRKLRALVEEVSRLSRRRDGESTGGGNYVIENVGSGVALSDGTNQVTDPRVHRIFTLNAGDNISVEQTPDGVVISGSAAIDFADNAETDAGVITNKAVQPEGGAYAYDRKRHWGQHEAGKGTETVTLTDTAGTVSLDGHGSNVFLLVMAGNYTLATPTNPIQGQVIKLRLKQDGTGGRTMTWPANWRWVMGVTPALTTAAGGVDNVYAAYDEGDAVWEATFLPDFTGTGTGYGQFAVGPAGPQGATGAIGPSGPSGITVGGVDGQVLTKLSSTDGDANWETPRYVPLAGAINQVLAKASAGDYDVAWVDPPSTSPTTTAGDLIRRGASADERLAIGTAGHVLTVVSGAPAWAAPSGGSGAVATDAIWDAKGDLAVGTGSNTAAKLTAGTNGHILYADSAESTGLKWAAPPTAGEATQHAVQASDLVITSNAAYQDTNLSATLVAGTYAFESYCDANCHSTPDMELQWTFSGTVSDVSAMRIALRSAAQGYDVPTALPIVYGMTVTARHLITFNGKLVVTAGGTFKLQAKQVTSSGTSVTFYAGSWLRVTKLA